MIGTDVSVIPLVVALTVGLVAFAALVPWLVHESRRPMNWGVPAPHRERARRARVPSLVLAARCCAVAVARRMEATSDAVVTSWQAAFRTARQDAVTFGARRTPDITDDVATARARAGRSRATRPAAHDVAPGRRGGSRSHHGRGGRTREQLYDEARRKNVKGRSKMTKAQLERAVSR